MQRNRSRTWLNLLLAILMAFGALPVWPDSAGRGGCCAMAMDAPAEAAHGCCGKDHDNGTVCTDIGCPGAHCAATAFLPSQFDLVVPGCAVSSFALSDSQSPVGGAAPPTPPPIYRLSA